MATRITSNGTAPSTTTLTSTPFENRGPVSSEQEVEDKLQKLFKHSTYVTWKVKEEGKAYKVSIKKFPLEFIDRDLKDSKANDYYTPRLFAVLWNTWYSGIDTACPTYKHPDVRIEPISNAIQAEYSSANDLYPHKQTAEEKYIWYLDSNILLEVFKKVEKYASRVIDLHRECSNCSLHKDFMIECPDDKEVIIDPVSLFTLAGFKLDLDPATGQYYIDLGGHGRVVGEHFERRYQDIMNKIMYTFAGIERDNIANVRFNFASKEDLKKFCILFYEEAKKFFPSNMAKVLSYKKITGSYCLHAFRSVAKKNSLSPIKFTLRPDYLFIPVQQGQWDELFSQIDSAIIAKNAEKNAWMVSNKDVRGFFHQLEQKPNPDQFIAFLGNISDNAEIKIIYGRQAINIFFTSVDGKFAVIEKAEAQKIGEPIPVIHNETRQAISISSSELPQFLESCDAPASLKGFIESKMSKK